MAGGQQQPHHGGVDPRHRPCQAGSGQPALPAGPHGPQQQKARQEQRQGRQQGAEERRARQQQGAEVAGQAEHGARHQLGQAVAGQELRLAEAVANALLQQRQHHVAAAEHQAARPIEVGNQLAGRALSQPGQADKQQAEQDQGRPVRWMGGYGVGAGRCCLPGAEQGGPDQHG